MLIGTCPAERRPGVAGYGRHLRNTRRPLSAGWAGSLIAVSTSRKVVQRWARPGRSLVWFPSEPQSGDCVTPTDRHIIVFIAGLAALLGAVSLVVALLSSRIAWLGTAAALAVVVWQLILRLRSDNTRGDRSDSSSSG